MRFRGKRHGLSQLGSDSGMSHPLKIKRKSSSVPYPAHVNPSQTETAPEAAYQLVARAPCAAYLPAWLADANILGG